jgi:uncharacterized protein (TIRG00374 family)
MTFFQRARWLLFDKTDPIARRLRWILKTLALIILFTVLFWVVPLSDVIGALASANPYLVALGYLLVFSLYFLDALKIRRLTDRQNMGLSTFDIMRTNIIMRFYSFVLPNSVVGSSLRWYRYSSPSSKPVEALAALTFNRIVDIVLSILVAIFFFLLAGRALPGIDVGQIAVVFFALAGVWIVITRLSKRIALWMGALPERISNKTIHWIVTKLAQVVSSYSLYADFPLWDILLIFTLGLVYHLVNFVAFVILAQSMNLPVDFSDLGWIRALTSLAGYLPVINVSIGISLRDVSLAALLTLIGVSLDQAVAFSVLVLGRSVFAGIAGGILELFHQLSVKR